MKGLVAEFWNAKDSWEYASKQGNSVDIEQCAGRMKAAIRGLVGMGLFQNRERMPSLMEQTTETP